MMQNELEVDLVAGRVGPTITWLTIPSPWTAEVVAAAGFDSVTIDLQHGLIGYETAVAMLQAMSGSSTRCRWRGWSGTTRRRSCACSMRARSASSAR